MGTFHKVDHALFQKDVFALCSNMIYILRIDIKIFYIIIVVVIPFPLT